MKRLLPVLLLYLVACPVVSQTVSVTFTWTATGNHGSSGTAAEYDFRYTDNPADSLFTNINKTFWIDNMPAPQPNGTPETYKVTGLEMGTVYWFTLYAISDNGLRSPQSNIVRVDTPGLTDVPPDPVGNLRVTITIIVDM
jgi:hypothetical protein